ARLKQACDDFTGACAILDEFVRLAQRRRFFPLWLAREAEVRARMQLRYGNVQAAIAWADTCDIDLDGDVAYIHEAACLTLARVRIAQGMPTVALSLLQHQLPAAEANGRIASAIEILTLRASALHALGDAPAALATLETALTRAEPEGYVRLFVDEGPAIVEPLLQARDRRSPVAQYADRLLAAFPGSRTATPPAQQGRASQMRGLIEPLSARELDVLRHMASGQSNQEIASTLVITLNTVKKHSSNLFLKLEVRSRTQAIARARALGLI